MRRSTPSAAWSSVIEPQQLAAIATLWKRTGRELTTRFGGPSMRPAIDDGAEVRLLCVDDVKIGDVVAYAYGDRVIVHRLVAQWGDRFVARGDANLLPDPLLLNREDIVGKVVNASSTPKSMLASMLLATVGVFGPRIAMSIVGALRVVHRRIRSG